MITNPKTSKKIKINSKTYNNLIKEGYILKDNVLVKPTQTIMDINGNEIFITSKDYINLLNIGYIPQNNSFVFNQDKIINLTLTNNDFPKGILDQLMNYSKITVKHEDDINSLIITNLSYKQIKDWWYKLYLPTGNIEITLHPTVTSTTNYGPAYNGTTNCVLQAIINHMKKNKYPIPDKLEKYNEQKGIFECDYEELSKICAMKIVVIAGNKKFIYGANRNRHSLLKLYYNNNHVELVKKEYKEKQNIYIVDDLKTIIDKITLRNITNIICNKETIYAIETDDIIYRKKYDYGIDLEENNVYSATRYYTNLFITNNNISNIKAYHDNIEAIKCIYSHGIHWSSTYAEKTITLDIINAYGNYHKTKYYNGFPIDLSQCVSDKVKEDDILTILNQAEGFALVEYYSIITNKVTKRWVSFPYIRYKWSLGEEIIIYYLMFGNRIDNLNLDMFENQDKRLFHRVLGNLIRKNKNESFTTTDPILAQNYYGIEVYKGLYYCDQEIECINELYHPHIVGYIHSYIEIEIELKLRHLKHNNIKILKIQVDGITIPEHSILENDNLYKIKYDGYNESQEYEPIYECSYPIKYSDEFYPYLLINTNKKHCIIGRPGTGKSYILKKLYNQCNNTVILTPTNDLLYNYPGLQAYTFHMFIERHMKKDTVLIDEYTMLSQELLDKLSEYKLLVLAGDDAQLISIKGTTIDIKDYNIITLTTVYRQTDPQFQKKIEYTRLTGDISWITKYIKPLQAIRQKFIILCSTHEQIDRINKIGLNDNPNEFIDGIKINSPIRFYKTTKNYDAGEFGYIVNIENNIMTIHMDRDGRDITCPIDIFNNESRIIKYSYAITYHAVQGKTIYNPIALSVDKLFDEKRMKYVGVSRVKEEDQLYILEEY